MNNTATLGQVQKILSFLNGIPSEQIQKVIESGFLSDVIRTGELDSIAKRSQFQKVRGMWDVIRSTTKFVGVSITVPHCPYKFADGADKFQLRCWLGEHGSTTHCEGHVDSGSALGQVLFEIYIPTKLESEDNFGWRDQLMHLGIDVQTGSAHWVLENKGHYDIVTVR